MFEDIKIKITGTKPLLMSNGASADPLNEFAQAMKPFKSKRGKTDEDHKKIGQLEFQAGLYVDDESRPCLPGYVLEAAIFEGAKKLKKGPVAKRSVRVENDSPLTYDGPLDLEALAKDERFSRRDMVKIPPRTGSPVPKVRPMFPEWESEVTVTFDSTLADRADVISWIELAGRAEALAASR